MSPALQTDIESRRFTHVRVTRQRKRSCEQESSEQEPAEQEFPDASGAEVVLTKVFDRLGDCLDKDGPSWLDRCQQLRKWVSEHGDAFPCDTSNDVDESCLARWLDTQKRHLRNGTLADACLAALEQIPGMPDRIHNWKLTLALWENR
eukprot:TRINITY_DN74753_c0_g1_i1.p1 TRINITY_DN74753_c0_g1~~TRINITY_DN74753_c0_g1_i1.p1  ORF type:complete len:157 (-),score=25.56 TRINITY_DN74753_c0_g1_i1:15-458(-)